jgi:KaiC/GvpD/RAD55 family RecA-like ATPase
MKSYSFKNQIIFKGYLDQIEPLNKIWYMRDFEVKQCFEDNELELKLYETISKFDKENLMIDKKKVNLYNLINLKLEKIYQDDELAELSKYLKNVSDIKINKEEFELVVNEVQLYLKELSTFDTLRKTMDIWEGIKNKSHYSEVSKEFYDIYQELEKSVKLTITGDDLGLDLCNLNENDILEAFDSGQKFPFSNNFPSLNTATEGGATTKTLNIAMGATYTGKTRLFINLALGYWLQGNDVVFHTLEISQEELLIRMLSFLLEKPKNTFKNYKPKNLLLSLNEYIKQNKIKSKFYIKEFPAGFYSVIDLREYISKTRQLDQRPLIYFIDGINNMESDNPAISRQNSYFKMKDIAYKLHGTAKKEDIMIWATAQLNKDAMKTVGNDMRKIQEGFSISQAMDLNIIIEHNEEMEELGVQALVIDKNRYAKPYRKPVLVVNENKDLFNLREISVKEDFYQEALGTYSKSSDNPDW